MLDCDRRVRIWATFVLALAALAPQVALACPTCKDTLTEQYVAAYGWSIIFMMAMPFLILGSLGAYFYWEVCKARRQQQESAGEPAHEFAEAPEQLPLPSA